MNGKQQTMLPEQAKLLEKEFEHLDDISTDLIHTIDRIVFYSSNNLNIDCTKVRDAMLLITEFVVDMSNAYPNDLWKEES